MNSRHILLATFAIGLFQCAPPAIAADFTFDGRTLTVPDGFIVERVADPSLVKRPVTCDFDERGRLYVADSSGSNDKVEQQLADKPHRVIRLEDTDGDGRFDKQTVFADKLMMPEGTMWFRGSLYVSTPPSIWKLTDTDGDGVADRREEWFKGGTLTGCANDLHGPYRGRDGWIYWCKGAFAEQTYDLPGKKGWKTKAAHIFRARPDGTGIEPVMTGGMDNPVDVVFTPEGERIFSCTFLQHPAGGHRDGLIHAIYGGVYGKDHNVLDGHVRTGDLMPVMAHLGPAAPCGLHYLESAQLGDDWRGNLLCCQFNLRKVSRHKLIPVGASYRTEDSELLTSNDMDFHPTDVIEDADGSVIVCDTGGWYKLCCPTSQFHRPDSLGAIYRVRRANTSKIDDPRGLKIDWAKLPASELVKHLGDARPVVRDRATEALVAHPKDAAAPLADVLKKSTSADARLAAVWTCCRIDAPWARELVRVAIEDKSETVQHAAIHAAGLWRDRDSAKQLGFALISDVPGVKRAAAEAYGRLDSETDFHAADVFMISFFLLTDDRAIEHSFAYAAIEMNYSSIEGSLQSPSPQGKRAALYVLDAIRGNHLKIEHVLPLLADPDRIVSDAAWQIAERHAEWGDQLADLFAKQLAAADQTTAPNVIRRLSQMAANPRVQQVILHAFTDEHSTAATRKTALSAMAGAQVKTIPEDWLSALDDSIQRIELTAECVEVLRSQSFSRKQAARVNRLLLGLAGNDGVAAAVRLQALSAMSGAIDELPAPVFNLLQTQLGKESEAAGRSTAVSVLAKAKLSTAQSQTVALAMKSLGPFDIAKLLPAFEGATDEKISTTVLTSLETGAGAAQLSAASLRPFVDKLSPSLRPRGDKLLLRADANLAQQRDKFDALLAALKETPGDIQRGRAIFHGKKVACAGCHAIAYVGGQIGPDLTRIAQIRTQRDLVEAIAFPSASFVRSYEPVLVVTSDGRQVSGLVHSETPQEIVLTLAADKIERIARDEIETIRPGTVSIMPQGLNQQLTRQELADLVAFLMSCR